MQSKLGMVNPLRVLRTPGRARSVLVRRLAAFACILAAGLNFLMDRRAEPEVLVFARSVAPGSVLSATDFTYARLPQAVTPEGALHDATPQSLSGSVVIAAAGAGEVVTGTRLLGPDLTAVFSTTASNVSDDTTSNSDGPLHMVPLRLAEPDIVPLLHHGDEVSVITSASHEDKESPFTAATTAATNTSTSTSNNDSDLAKTLIAAGGRVVSTAMPEDSPRGASPGTILLAMPAADAERVAALSLTQPLTVVLTGPRATSINAPTRQAFTSTTAVD